jgi:hypothetical protein
MSLAWKFLEAQKSIINVGLSNMLGCGSLVPCPIEDTLFCLRLMEVAAKQTRPCCLIRRLSQIVTSKGLIRVVMRCVIYFVFVQISMCTWCCPNNLTSWTNSWSINTCRAPPLPLEMVFVSLLGFLHNKRAVKQASAWLSIDHNIALFSHRLTTQV